MGRSRTCTRPFRQRRARPGRPALAGRGRDATFVVDEVLDVLGSKRGLAQRTRTSSSKSARAATPRAPRPRAPRRGVRPPRGQDMRSSSSAPASGSRDHVHVWHRAGGTGTRRARTCRKCCRKRCWDAFTEAAAVFRAAPKSTLGPAENAVLGRRHLKAVIACRILGHGTLAGLCKVT